jgi:AraC-like DNA-binding protein
MTVHTAVSAPEWQVLSSQAFVPLRVRTGERFVGSLDHRGRAHSALSRIQSGECRVARDRRFLSASADDIALFSFQVAGRNLVEQDGKRATVAPGDAVMYLTRSTYELDFPDPAELVVLQVPTEWLGIPASRLSAMAARRMPVRNDPALRTVSRVVRSEFSGRPVLDDTAQSIRVATELLAAALRQRGQQNSPPRSHAALFASFHRTVTEYLDDPRLDVSALAAVENVSVRTVHQVFSERGLRAAAFIRSERMRRASRLLRDTNLTVPDIALRCGIGDPSVFARTFRHELDMSPTQYRAQHADSIESTQ